MCQGNLDSPARDARIITLATLGGTKLPAGTDIGAFVRKRIRFEGSSLRSRDVGYQVRCCASSLPSPLILPDSLPFPPIFLFNVLLGNSDFHSGRGRGYSGA